MQAWRAYEADNLLQMVDPALNKNFPADEAMRFLKVGLCCVQETAKLRPNMSEAVDMLTNKTAMEDVHISNPGFVADLRQIRTKEETPSSQESTSTGAATYASSMWSSANLAR